MHTNYQTLKLIAEVKNTIDPESAYLLRSRLARVALSAARSAARRAGSDVPVLPNHVRPTSNAETPAERVLGAAQRVIETTRTLCQPSEALDSRWQEGWAEALDELASLEAAVLDLDAEDSEPRTRV